MTIVEQEMRPLKLTTVFLVGIAIGLTATLFTGFTVAGYWIVVMAWAIAVTAAASYVMLWNSPSSIVRREHELRPAHFSTLRITLEFVRYDGILLDFIAEGPKVDEKHTGEWLIVWREGGPLGSARQTPERWLAIPISEQRKYRITNEHISLREAIILSEWEPYILEGNPLNPGRVTRINVSDLPTDYIPTADISVYGRLLHAPRTRG